MPPRPKRKPTMHERIFKDTPTAATNRTFGGFFQNKNNSNTFETNNDLIEQNNQTKTIIIGIIILILIIVFVMVLH